MVKVEDRSQVDHSLTVSIKMECEFCEQNFESTTDRNTHTMEHFVREFCSKCNKVLLRIGDELYILHSTITCIPNEYENNENETFIAETDIKIENIIVEPTNICALEWKELDENSFTSGNTFLNKPKSAHKTSQIKKSQDVNQTTENEKMSNAKSDKRKSDRNIKKFKCKIEGCTDYYSMNSMGRHLAKHPKKFECNICNDKFRGKYQIEKHITKEHHTYEIEQHINQIVEVITNDEKNNAKAAKKDVVIDKNIKIKQCTFEGCNELLSLNAWRRHLDMHRGKKFECDICKAKFPEKYRLRRHILKNHDPTHAKEKVDKRIKKAKERKAIRNSKIYPCKFKGCSEMMSLNNWGNHMAKHRDVKFECDICKSTFITKNRLREHMLNKHDPTSKQFKCDVCESKFVLNSSLRRHHRLWHLKERNFMCSECGKRFATQSILNMHMNLHTGEKPYKCKFDGCTKRFRTQTQRHEHFRCHSGEKPFHCPVGGCTKEFAYPVDLKRHKFNAHGIYTKKYPCQICEEIFPENMLLTKHMRQHEKLAQT